jgi:PAS domain S-box-containing protein
MTATQPPWSGWFSRDLIENMPVAVYVCDAEGVLVAYNRRAEELWGVTPTLGNTQQRFCGAHRLYLADGTYVPHSETPLADVLRTRKAISFEAIVGRPDGTRRNVSANVAPLFDDSGTFMGFVNCVLDNTEIKRAEASRDRMWRLSADLLLVTTLEGTVSAMNPAWTAQLGWTEAELLGTNFLDLIHPDDVTATGKTARSLKAGQPAPRFENRCRTRDGGYRWLSWTATRDAEFLHATARDITTEKEQAAALLAAEEALRQSQKMEAIGQLTGGVAHDFNNLLTIIRSSADLLRRPGLPEERRERYVDAIADTADRAARLTGQLLAFARRQALKPEIFDACERVRSVAEMIRTLTGSRVAVQVDLDYQKCAVVADISQFETALINLAVNARDAMNGEGRLTLRVRQTDRVPPVRGHTGAAGRFVAVSVSDTGCGIAPEALVRIFEPFFTTKEVGKGTGLGLSQVYGFAKQSGGEVQVESEPGRGSSFTIYLPEARPESASGSRPHLMEEGAAELRARILVVEDNSEVGEFLTQMLREMGHETTWAPNAQTALMLLDRDPGAYDVVFSDVVMPGMSGLELAEHIRATHADLPVILTSGYNHVSAPEDVHGFELLRKPYSISALSRVLMRTLMERV